MDRSTPGLPVHRWFPEFTQTHVHWVSDAIQPSHPLSSPSPAFSLSQNQGLFKWVSSSHHWWYRTGNLYPKGMRQSTGHLVDCLHFLNFFDVSVFILRFPWGLYSVALRVSYIGNPCSWKMSSVGHVLLPACCLPLGWHELPPVSKAFKSAKVETRRESAHSFQPLSDHCAPVFPAHPTPTPPGIFIHRWCPCLRGCQKEISRSLSHSNVSNNVCARSVVSDSLWPHGL